MYNKHLQKKIDLTPFYEVIHEVDVGGFTGIPNDNTVLEVPQDAKPVIITIFECRTSSLKLPAFDSALRQFLGLKLLEVGKCFSRDFSLHECVRGGETTAALEEHSQKAENRIVGHFLSLMLPSLHNKVEHEISLKN